MPSVSRSLIPLLFTLNFAACAHQSLPEAGAPTALPVAPDAAAEESVPRPKQYQTAAIIPLCMAVEPVVRIDSDLAAPGEAESEEFQVAQATVIGVAAHWSRRHPELTTCTSTGLNLEVTIALARTVPGHGQWRVDEIILEVTRPPGEVIARRRVGGMFTNREIIGYLEWLLEQIRHPDEPQRRSSLDPGL